MKKLALIILAFVVSLISTYGQEKENSLLWKVSGNGLEQPSYLYGTFHLLCPADLQIKDKVQNAFDESDQLVLELDFDDPSVMPTIQQNMMYKDGTTAKDYLNKKEYNMIKTFFNDSLNMPFQRLQAVKPFFLSSITLRHFLGCQPASFEKRLTSMAKKDSIEVKGLETVQEQLNFIEDIPMKMQKKMLLENLKEFDKSKKMFDQLIDHYLNEDISEINNLVDEYMSDEYAGFKKDLLTDRNKNWIPDIEKLMKNNASFIAFGAGHLPGNNGVIELLREAGYTVEAVK